MSNVKAITENIVENGHIRKVIFRSLMIAAGVLSLTYLFLISSITFNVLAYKSLSASVRTLQSSVSQSEVAYMDSVGKINKEYALAHGFVDVRQGIFAVRDSDATSVAIR